MQMMEVVSQASTTVHLATPVEVGIYPNCLNVSVFWSCNMTFSGYSEGYSVAFGCNMCMMWNILSHIKLQGEVKVQSQTDLSNDVAAPE